MKKIERKIIVFILCIVMTAGLASCGKSKVQEGQDNQGQGQAQNSSEERPEYLWVSDFKALPTDGSFYAAQFAGEYLYSVRSDYNGETYMSTTKLVRYSLGEEGLGEPEEIFSPSETDGERNINNFYVDSSENLYFMEYVYPPLDESGEFPDNYWEQRRSVLSKYDSQGQKVYEEDITDSINQDGNFWVQEIVADEDGRLYLVCSDRIWLYDKEGKASGEISVGTGNIQSVVPGKDGKVYCIYFDYSAASSSTVLAELDIAGRKLGATYKDYPGDSSLKAVMMDETTFVAADYSSVYLYYLDTQTKEKLFSWIDCDINGSYAEKMSFLGDGRLVVLIQDWESNQSDMAFLTKTPSGQVAQKETITVGTIYEDSTLSREIVAFNKANNNYRITLKVYKEEGDWTETTFQDAVTAMNNAITSDNCPDILVISAIDYEPLAAKGVFEDLSPWLEKSTALDRDDYFESLLEGLTIDGKLISIPYSFSLQSIVGKTADVGAKAGWTLEDFIGFAKSHPEADILDYCTRERVMSDMLVMNASQFVDEKSGQCNFDSQEFKEMLSFAATLPSTENYEDSGRALPYRIADGEVLLETTYISSYEDIQVKQAEFGNEPITFIGYPNAEGKSGSLMQPYDIYAISAKSDKKEAAWSFIEGILTKDPEDNMFFYGLPSRKSMLKKQREKATKIEYVIDSETGEPLLDENGEPIIRNTGGGIGYGGEDGQEWFYEFHVTTEEEADILDELIETASVARTGMNEQIMNIILEEAAPFFDGQKSVEEVANIIQSRISLYVKENQ
ncbi:MAG: extracellular solute-binding protein [Roseburia sp.]|nr:extracellular solute-binding protein [Roseburia sp.]